MPWKVTIMRPGEDDLEDVIDLPAEPKMPQLQTALRQILGAPNPEHVRVLAHGKMRDMFVDEDGHAKGLALNDSATAYYRASWLKAHPGTPPASLPPIVGPAVLFALRIWS
jgi:hypothetical protein